LGHEIATRRDHPEALACRRALYHHFSRWPRVVDGDEALLFGYYNRGRPWHRALFEAFAGVSAPETECVAFPLDRFVASETAAVSGAEGRLSIAEASPDERERAARLAAQFLPPLAIRAFAFEAADLQSSCLHPAYPAAGLQRRRHLLVVRDGDHVTGAAVCDTASGSLSLFNVLNSALLLFDGDAAPEAKSLLVRHVRAFFRELGIPAPLVMAPPGSLPAALAPGLQLAETMGCIVWTARGLQRYERFIDETIANYPLGAPGESPPQGRRMPA
jgi:hypothetical protein